MVSSRQSLQALHKEVSVTICKDSQITVLKMVKIVMFLSI